MIISSIVEAPLAILDDIALRSGVIGEERHSKMDDLLTGAVTAERDAAPAAVSSSIP